MCRLWRAVMIFILIAVILFTVRWYDTDLEMGLMRSFDIFSILPAVIAVLIIWVSIQVIRLLNALNAIEKNPCQKTVDRAVKMLSGWSKLTRSLIYSNFRKLFRTGSLREIYNRHVFPNPNITVQSKVELYKHLQTLGFCDLLYDGDAAKRDYGKRGEEYAWKLLKELPQLGEYEVYFNVELHERSQIDIVVVSRKTGIFVLEVKSWSGNAAVKIDGETVRNVWYKAEDEAMQHVPGQLRYHRKNLEALTKKLGISDYQIQTLVVLSYPEDDVVRMPILESFPEDYPHIIPVRDVVKWLQAKSGQGLTDAQWKALGASLEFHSERWIGNRANYIRSIKTEEDTKEQAPQSTCCFCSKCGKQIEESSNFCAHCGQKK